MNNLINIFKNNLINIFLDNLCNFTFNYLIFSSPLIYEVSALN
jgi:hypothetical protein